MCTAAPPLKKIGKELGLNYAKLFLNTIINDKSQTLLSDFFEGRGGCTQASENHTNGYPFEPFKPLACRLSAVQERHEAVRTAVITRSKNICIRSSGSGYPFGKQSYPFERLPLAVQKKFASVRTARVIRSEKKLSVRTAAASRSKKIITRSNG